MITVAVKLHIDGRYIKDELGNIVQLRGVVKHGFEDYPEGSWVTVDGDAIFGTWNESIVKANLDAMKSWGCNTIRVYANAEYWLNSAVHRQCIKDLITWAGERDMQVIYTFWRIMNGASQTAVPFPPYCESNPYINSVEDFVNLWVNVATELRDYPNVLFELWNEPNGNEAAINAWFDAVQLCIPAIRNVTDHIIIVQRDYSLWCVINYPNDPHTDMTWIQDPRVQGTNILYSHHSYGEWRYWVTDHYEWAYQYSDVKQALQVCNLNWCSETANKAVIIGEIGRNLDNSNVSTSLEEYRNALKILNEWQISFIGFYWWTSGDLALLMPAPNFEPSNTGQIFQNALAPTPPTPQIPAWLVAIPIIGIVLYFLWKK